jgi:hypothetical protein
MSQPPRRRNHFDEAAGFYRWNRHRDDCGPLPAQGAAGRPDDRGPLAGQRASAATAHESFRLALRQLGFVEGQNLAIELRYARGGQQQLPELAAELARMKVTVFATFGDLAPKLAQQASGQTPIVAMNDDIIGSHLVSSLSHPEGNITGLTLMSAELSAKRLEVLQEMKPSIKRVTALWDPTTGASQVTYTEQAAKSLNIELRVREVQRARRGRGSLPGRARRWRRRNQYLRVTLSLRALPRDDRAVRPISIPSHLSMEGTCGSRRPGIARTQSRFTMAASGNDRGQGA